MKTIIYILTLCFCYSCAKTNKGFIVKGEIENYTGTKLFVREMIPDNQAWMNDTIEVVNGKFIYEGKVKTPYLVYFVPENYQGRYELFLDNSNIRLKADANDFSATKIKGSEIHNEYMEIKQKSASIIQQYRQYQIRKSDALKNSIETKDSTKVWSDQLLNFIEAQPNYRKSMVLPYFASEWFREDELQNWDIYLSALDTNAQKSLYAQYGYRITQQAKNAMPGMPAFNFQLQDTLGKTYQLADYKGKYVLLEFSASWCGWCKLEIPFLKRVHNLTKDKNFVMFTINMDNERSLWVNEVAKENLPWPVISDLQAFDGELAKRYNINGIPVIYLIDPEGKIVENHLRGEKMIEYIKNIFPETNTVSNTTSTK